MARSKFPDALEMRRLKYDPGVTDAERDAMAMKLAEAGRTSEALLLYERRPQHPALQAAAKAAIKDGNAFRLFSIRRMGVPVTEEQLRHCGANAEAKDRWYDAHRVWTELKDEAGLARAREKMPTYKVAVPANKV